MNTKTKPSKCKVCKGHYVRLRPLQSTCSPGCAISHVEACKAKNERKAKAEERRQDKEKREAMRTLPQLKAAAQKDFNAFVRARDAGKPCISCGKPLGNEPNSYDAGHYRSVGSAPHMRYVETNCHGQCKHCNNHLAGNHVAYRTGLIERVGLQEVERLERDQTVRKYTREGLIEIARYYRTRARVLKGNE